MKRIFLIIGCALGAFALVVFIYVCSLDSRSGWYDGQKLMTGLTAYSRDVQARGEKLPLSVSAEELVSGGWVKKEDLGSLQEMHLIFSLPANETHPSQVLIRGRSASGQEYAVLGDGSVQEIRR
jgi:hypothetical protein